MRSFGLLRNFSSDELEGLLTTQKLQDISQKIADEKAREALIIELVQWFSRQSVKTRSQGMQGALEVASVPIDLVWGMLSYLSLGAAALPITLVFLAFAVLTGAGFGYERSQKNERRNRENQDFFQTTALKLMVCDEIASRLQTQIGIPSGALRVPPVDYPSLLLQKKSINKWPSVGVGGAAVIVLFGTYYLGGTSILEILGCTALAGAMGGPIGLAVAAFFVMSVGVFLAYKHYKIRQNAQAVKSLKTEMNRRLSEKVQKCKRLKTIRDTLNATDSMSGKKLNRDSGQDDLVLMHRSRQLSKMPILADDLEEQETLFLSI